MKKSLSRFATALCLTLSLAVAAWGTQRTATVGGETKPQTQSEVRQPQSGSKGVTTPKPPPAPSTVKAKYEGGVIGYGKTEGAISFDDANRRLVFKDKKTNREYFSLPYDSVQAAWADKKSQRSTAGTVIASTVPYGLGLPGLFMKSTTRYLVLQYRDPDTRAEGVASFKLADKEILASVLYAFAEKAGLTQRGEAFVRSSSPTATTKLSNE